MYPFAAVLRVMIVACAPWNGSALYLLGVGHWAATIHRPASPEQLGRAL